MSIAYSVYAFVALGIQPAMHMHLLWPALLYHIVLYHLKNGTIFGGEEKVTEYEMCVLMFSATFV